ncbi:GNAT family N-acetyltransferase [Agromyces sp. G08B096]|uniref:GNAT family N-acetyltransferase n=1 Tax=Agromyces sp. G08B096 TaxID=3156399 RepID=A0AAU7W524_9MICO
MSDALLPLAERVGAVAAPVVPTHPDATIWRAAAPADVDALLAFFADVARADHPNWTETRDEVLEAFELPHIDPARDTLVGLAADGSVLAYGTVVVPPGQETLVRAIVLGAVRPDVRRRGIGTALIEWQLARALQVFAGSPARLPGWIMGYADERAPDAARLLQRHGMPLTRHFFELQRDLARPVDPVPLSDTARRAGVRIVPWADSLAESARLARNAAFADHWGSQSTSRESWAGLVTGETFAPGLSFLATVPDDGAPDDGAPADGAPAGERVVAFVLALRNEGDWAGQGFTSTYVQLVGVVREHRGSGLARALLAEHLAAAAAAGLERATLDVDAENPTGALGLYRGMGFEVANSHQSYVRVL